MVRTGESRRFSCCSHYMIKQSTSSPCPRTLAKYAPAIKLLNEGKTITEASKATGVKPRNFSAWLRKNYPQILEMTRSGMMLHYSGKRIFRRSYDRFHPIACYMNWHPSKPTAFVAKKFGVSASSLASFIRKHYCDVWKRHCRACKKKRSTRLPIGQS